MVTAAKNWRFFQFLARATGCVEDGGFVGSSNRLPEIAFGLYPQTGIPFEPTNTPYNVLVLSREVIRYNLQLQDE